MNSNSNLDIINQLKDWFESKNYKLWKQDAGYKQIWLKIRTETNTYVIQCSGGNESSSGFIRLCIEDDGYDSWWGFYVVYNVTVIQMQENIEKIVNKIDRFIVSFESIVEESKLTLV